MKRAEPGWNGFRLIVACPCGVVFERWVTALDAESDLHRAALTRRLLSAGFHGKEIAYRARVSVADGGSVGALANTVGTASTALGTRSAAIKLHEFPGPAERNQVPRWKL